MLIIIIISKDWLFPQCCHLFKVFVFFNLKQINCKISASFALKAHSLLPLYSYITLHISDRC